MPKDRIKTTFKEISDYWKHKKIASFLDHNWDQESKICWRCHTKRSIHRCHIIPDSRSGKDSPHNLVLLCTRCHKEAPNVSDPEIMWDWLRAYCESRANIAFWQQQIYDEYEFIYGESALEYLLTNKITLDDFSEFSERAVKGTQVHFGEGKLNLSTMVGLLRMFIKENSQRRMGRA